MITQRWSAIGLGIACGFLSAYTLGFASWWNLLLWAIAGVALGYFVVGTREVLWCGALYGFFLSMAFLLPFFRGASDQLLAFTILTLALTVVSIAGALASVVVGSWIRWYTGPLW